MRVAAAGGFVALMVACSSAGGPARSTPPDAPVVTSDQAAADLAGALCARVDACAHANLVRFFGDVSTCATRYRRRFTATFRAVGTGSTPAGVEACAAGYASASCAELFAGDVPAGCDIHGSLAQGAACGDGVQCAGAGSYCSVPTNEACGACATQVGTGGGCSTMSDCQPGLVCAFSPGGPSGVCLTPGALGASCDAPHPCAGPLLCVNGACSQPSAQGSPCDPSADACDPLVGLFCDPMARTCKPAATAALGAPCGAMPDGSTTSCTAGATCNAGTCQAAAADGQPCDPDQGPPCLALATCTNGVCTPIDASTCR